MDIKEMLCLASFSNAIATIAIAVGIRYGEETQQER